MSFPLAIGWLSWASRLVSRGTTGGLGVAEHVETFEAFFVREYPAMVALAAAVSGDRSSAEDIAQEAMRKAADRWGEVSGFDKPGAWVRRVTINGAISRKRKIAREAKALLRMIEPAEDVLGEAPPEHAPVWDAVAGLSGKQRSVISLHYLEDRSVDEIAAVLDMAPSTVRVHLHRGRGNLAERLGGEFAGV